MTTTRVTAKPLPQSTGSVPTINLGEDVEQQRERLLELRTQLVQERERATSPAVARALELADMYLFLGLGLVGHTDELFPG